MIMKSLTYSALEFAINGIEVFLRLYLLLFYTEKVGLDNYYVGIALGISILVDAFLDPLIGSFVDNYKVKNKQRYNILAYGIVVLGFSFFALFNPPAFSNEVLDFIYLLIVSLAFNISYSFVTIPYSSCVADITSTSEERLKLIGWKSAIGNLGAFIGIGIPGIFLIYDSLNAYSYSSVSFVLILTICFVLSFYTIRKHNKKSSELTSSRISFEKIYKGINEPFIILFMAAFFMANIGLTINSSLAIYFYKLRLKFSEEEIQIVLGSFLIFASLFVPFWAYFSKRFNKLYLSSAVLMIMGAINCFIYVLLPEKNLMLALVFASFLGGFLVSVSFLLESVLTDFIFYKEKQLKTEKMGFYYSIWKMNNKISRGLALTLTGMILNLVDVKNTEPGAKFDSLAYAFGPGVGIFFILACILLLVVPKKYITLFKNDINKKLV